MTDYVKNTCKIGLGNTCCRYLVAGPSGFECAKFTSLKSLLDGRVDSNTINAQGDNCEGLTLGDALVKLN